MTNPATAYRRGNEQVRSIMNRAFLGRLRVEGRKIVGHELREPFNTLAAAYQREQTRQTTAPHRLTTPAAAGSASPEEARHDPLSLQTG